MKKLLSLALAILAIFALALSIVGCESGSDEFVGEYIRKNDGCRHNIVHTVDGERMSTGELSVDGDGILTLNNGGVGTYKFIAYNSRFEDLGRNYLLFEGDITWEDVDGILYVKGTLYAKDESNKTRIFDKEFKLEGKTLVDVVYPTVRYEKQ